MFGNAIVFREYEGARINGVNPGAYSTNMFTRNSAAQNNVVA
jgi:hypothetical protein